MIAALNSKATRARFNVVSLAARLIERNGSGKMARPVERVNHPAHYGGDAPHETVKCLEAWGLESDALLWNAVKYISRAGKKGDVLEDLQKARWYLERRIKALESLAQGAGQRAAAGKTSEVPAQPPCPKCRGLKGRKMALSEIPGSVLNDGCNGEGWEPCPECGGSGVAPEKKP